MSFKSFFVLLAVVNFVHSIDYCSQAIKTACGGSPHVACPIPVFPVTDTCKNPKLVKFTDAQKKLMIDAHNIKRNSVASGQASTGSVKLSAATNMKVVTWNADSEYLAGLNTLQCKMNHDACRYTTMYNGQNLYKSSSSADNLSIETVIQKAVDGWFSEIFCNGFDSNRCIHWSKSSSIHSFSAFGHFSQLVWAETAQIGCSMSTWYDGTKWYNYLIACNYAVGGNMKGSPVYKTGVAASACGSIGVSKVYTSMCN